MSLGSKLLIAGGTLGTIVNIAMYAVMLKDIHTFPLRWQYLLNFLYINTAVTALGALGAGLYFYAQEKLGRYR